MPRREEPTPGSITTTKMEPAGKYLYAAAISLAANETSCAGRSWLMSTIVTSGLIPSMTPFMTPA
jgi:hypothetical protein